MPDPIPFKRAVDTTMLTHITAAQRAGRPIYPVGLLFVDWPGDPAYAHSNKGNLTWGGQTWQGVGGIGGISIPGEAEGLVPEEAQFLMVAPLAQALDLAVNAGVRGRRVLAYLGVTTTPGGTTLIGEPLQVFAGYAVGSPDPDSFQYAPDGSSAVFTLRAKAGQPARSTASIVHTSEDQNKRYPGDTFFDRCGEGGNWRSVPPQWPAA